MKRRVFMMGLAGVVAVPAVAVAGRYVVAFDPARPELDETVYWIDGPERKLMSCVVDPQFTEVWWTWRSYDYPCGTTVDIKDIVTRQEIEDASDFPRQPRDIHLPYGLIPMDLVHWLDKRPTRPGATISFRPGKLSELAYDMQRMRSPEMKVLMDKHFTKET